MAHQSHLAPLRHRLSNTQQARRGVRMNERRTHRQQVAMAIGQSQAIGMASLNVIRRGFFGRLKWLLFGK